jgi:hypothetical protein
MQDLDLTIPSMVSSARVLVYLVCSSAQWLWNPAHVTVGLARKLLDRERRLGGRQQGPLQ